MNERRLLPAGTYSFEVTTALHKTSKAGNPMLEISLRLDNDHRTKCIDWLVLTEKASWKISSFAKAVGIEEEGIENKIEEIMKCNGRCVVGTRKYTDRDGDEKEVNEVTRYLHKDEMGQKTIPFLDDDVPF